MNLTCGQIHITATTVRYRAGSSSQRAVLCYPFVITPSLTTTNLHFIVIVLFFFFLRVLQKCNHIVCNLLILDSSTQYNVFVVHSNSCFYQQLFLLPNGIPLGGCYHSVFTSLLSKGDVGHFHRAAIIIQVYRLYMKI